MEGETKSYKLDYLLRDNIGEAGTQEAEAELRKMIEEGGGIIIQENSCRRQSLAYPVKKHNAAHVGAFKFIFPVEKILSLEKNLKKMNLLRFLLKQAEKVVKKPPRKKPGHRAAISKSKKLGIKTLLSREETPLKIPSRGEPLRVEEIDKKLKEIIGE